MPTVLLHVVSVLIESHCVQACLTKICEMLLAAGPGSKTGT